MTDSDHLHNNQDNPFKPPDAARDGMYADGLQNAQIRSPGLLAHLVIAVLGLFASGCTFFCTCYGVGLAGIAMTGWLGFVAVGSVAGILAACIVVVTSTRAMFRWYSNTLNKNE